MVRHEIEVTIKKLHHASVDGPAAVHAEIRGNTNGIQEGMECTLTWDTRHECKDLIAFEQYIDLSSGGALMIYNYYGTPQYGYHVTFCSHCGTKLQVE